MGKDGKVVETGRRRLAQVAHTMMTRQQMMEKEILMERQQLAKTLSMVKRSESIILESKAKAIEQQLYGIEKADENEIKIV